MLILVNAGYCYILEQRIHTVTETCGDPHFLGHAPIGAESRR